MGQKVHPIGLRVGVYRKWNSSWYGNLQENNSRIFSSTVIPFKGTFVPRSVNYISGVQDFVESLIRRYSFTKLSSSCSNLPVDFRLYKGKGGHMFGFLTYIKLITAR